MSIVSDAYWCPVAKPHDVRDSCCGCARPAAHTAPRHCTEIALHSLAIVRASLALADAIAAIAIAADKTQHWHSHIIAAK